jgi:hypothetical protein
MYLGLPQIYMMVILHARTSEMVLCEKLSITQGTWPFRNMQNAFSELIQNMAMLMQRVEPMKALEEEETFDETDADDDISDDENDDI